MERAQAAVLQPRRVVALCPPSARGYGVEGIVAVHGSQKNDDEREILSMVMAVMIRRRLTAALGPAKSSSIPPLPLFLQWMLQRKNNKKSDDEASTGVKNSS